MRACAGFERYAVRVAAIARAFCSATRRSPIACSTLRLASKRAVATSAFAAFARSMLFWMPGRLMPAG